MGVGVRVGCDIRPINLRITTRRSANDGGFLILNMLAAGAREVVFALVMLLTVVSIVLLVDTCSTQCSYFRGFL